MGSSPPQGQDDRPGCSGQSAGSAEVTTATKDLSPYKRLMKRERDKKKRKPRVSAAEAPLAGLCGAKKRGGGTCQQKAGLGTDHVGIGRCKHHGGATPNASLNAAKQQAIFMGAPKEINPVQALIWCIHVTAGEIEWITEQMKDIQQDEWFEHTVLGRQMHVFQQERAKCIDRLAKYSKDAIALGIAERAVRLAEQYGGMIARLLSGIAAEMEFTNKQKDLWPKVVRKHLVLIESSVDALGPSMKELPALPARVSK